MTSCLHGDGLQTKFSPITPHFIKIVVEETLQENRLRVPEKFVRNYGDTLSNLVVLKLPCGSTWELGLKKCGDKVWLEKGWPAFSKHYSIEYGSMIEFGYEGNSNFYTHIFDKSTVEIDYPVPTNPNDFEKYKNQGQSQKLKRKEIDEDDGSVEILDNSTPFSYPEKRMKTSTAKNDSSFCENGTSSSSKLPEQKATTSQVKEAKVPKDFSSDNPYFRLTMQPAYINNRANLRIPAKFARTYINEKQCNVSLQLSDGTAWDVQYRVRGPQDTKLQAELCQGWNLFRRENNLELGDVCVFELITKGNEISFKVTIFRVADEADYNMSIGEKSSVDSESGKKINKFKCSTCRKVKELIGLHQDLGKLLKQQACLLKDF